MSEKENEQIKDHVSHYRDSVHQWFQRPHDSNTEKQIDVEFFPSFHPEALLSITRRPDSTVIELLSFTASVWHYEQYQWHKEKWPESHPIPDAPDLYGESVSLTEAKSHTFWNTLLNVDLGTITATENPGLDGMSVSVTYRESDSTHSFKTWSPKPTSREGQCIGLVYEFAFDNLSNPESIIVLEQLHTYLHRGLPARVISGDPICIRLFGLMSISDSDELRNLFDSYQNELPLLVDMSNFDGMGTMLVPLFQNFDKRPGKIAWYAPNNTAEYLRSADISTEVLFNDKETALEWLRH